MPSTDKQSDQTCVLVVGKLFRSFADSLSAVLKRLLAVTVQG